MPEKLTETFTVAVTFDADPAKVHPREREAIARDITGLISYVEMTAKDWMESTWPFFNPTVRVRHGDPDGSDDGLEVAFEADDPDLEVTFEFELGDDGSDG